MILPAQHIRQRSGIISPFVERSVSHGMSYGLSIAGYDVRIAQTMALGAGDFALASTVERFDMPLDLIAFVKDKSSWARQGLAIQNTVIEPGWNGYLTIELSNHGGQTLYLKEGMPIAQIVFHLLAEPAEVGYSGKYQGQENEPVPARVEGDLSANTVALATQSAHNESGSGTCVNTSPEPDQNDAVKEHRNG